MILHNFFSFSYDIDDSKICVDLRIKPPNTYRSKVKNVQNIFSHGNTPIGLNLVCLYQIAKKILPDSNSW